MKNEKQMQKRFDLILFRMKIWCNPVVYQRNMVKR